MFSGHLSLHLVDLRLKHQVHRFMGCDYHIEVAVKRWKSLLDVDLLRARDASRLADVWLHGELLYVLMLDKRLRRTLGETWSGLDRAHTATWWRPWKLPHDEVARHITGVLSWQSPQWATCWQVLAERPRRRQLQRLLQEVMRAFQMLNIHLQPPPRQVIAA